MKKLLALGLLASICAVGFLVAEGGHNRWCGKGCTCQMQTCACGFPDI